MSSIWWFVFGILVGWLLSWWLSRNYCKKPVGHDDEKSSPNMTAQPLVAKSESMTKPAPAKAPVAKKAVVKSAAKSTTKSATKPAEKPAEKIIGFDKTAALLAGIKVKGPDDLEVIEGIGPKISELLKADGIADFAALANATQTTLQAILDKAGARYKLAKPGTWPEQAKLANAGKWAELKALQDSLSGGKR